MKTMINLFPKAIRFLVEALEFRIAAYQSQLEVEALSEDEISDLTNDLLFLESLHQELQKALNVPEFVASNVGESHSELEEFQPDFLSVPATSTGSKPVQQITQSHPSNSL